MELKIVGGWKKIEYVSSLPALFLLFPRHPDLTDVGDRLLVLGLHQFLYLYIRMIPTQVDRNITM